MEGIAHLAKCRTCRGEGVLRATISLDGGFTPGKTCMKCGGSGYVVVGGCCCEDDEEDEPATLTDT
jgi:DnaJ-class molecular chaperone